MTEVFEKPWVEKYRPDNLSDVVGNYQYKRIGNRELILQLAEIVQTGNVPHMILVVC